MDPTETTLNELLRSDPSPEVRAEAARSIAVTMGEEAVEPLVAALDDPHSTVRRAATLGLGRIRDPRSVDALVGVLESRPELWQEASAALAHAADSGVVPRLVPLLGSDTAHVRQGAARAIGALRHPNPPQQGPIFEYVDDEGHRHPLL